MGRIGVVACVLGLAASAAADPSPPLEASGFVGIDYFGDNIQLGNSWAKEQIPGTSPLVGARVAWLALPALWTRDHLDLQLAAEAELSLATAFTGGNFDGGRMAYFAPVFGWRGHAMLRLAGLIVQPHLVLGVGGETIASSSPYMAKETDPVIYWGPGASYPVAEGWQLRVDLRHGIMAAREGSVTSTFEVQLGLSTTFGFPRRRAPRPAEPIVVVAPHVDETDSDGDGIPDRLDKCPHEAETVNGVADDDGCPEPDPDGDGILGAADKCPNEAEDVDHFQDEDGCPDPDNDGDGIPDARDACPNEPETRNGIDDQDGCPDTVPADVTAAIAAGATVKFDPGRARIANSSKKALEPLLGLLRDRPALAIAVIAHPDKGPADQANDLAKRRGDAVKWYLVDQGVAADQVTVSVGPGTGLLEVQLVIAPLHAQ